MHRVGIDRAGEIGANGALGGLLGIGRTHKIAILDYRSLALKYLNYHRSGGHEFNEVGKKWALPVLGVKTSSHFIAQAQHLRADLDQGAVSKVFNKKLSC